MHALSFAFDVGWINATRPLDHALGVTAQSGPTSRTDPLPCLLAGDPTDLLRHTMHRRGADLLVSPRLLALLRSFDLPEHHVLDAHVSPADDLGLPTGADAHPYSWLWWTAAPEDALSFEQSSFVRQDGTPAEVTDLSEFWSSQSMDMSDAIELRHPVWRDASWKSMDLVRFTQVAGELVFASERLVTALNASRITGLELPD